MLNQIAFAPKLKEVYLEENLDYKGSLFLNNMDFLNKDDKATQRQEPAHEGNEEAS